MRRLAPATKKVRVSALAGMRTFFVCRSAQHASGIGPPSVPSAWVIQSAGVVADGFGFAGGSSSSTGAMPRRAIIRLTPASGMVTLAR